MYSKILDEIISTLKNGNCETVESWSETTYQMNTVTKFIVTDTRTGISTSFIAEQYEENDFVMLYIEQKNLTGEIVSNIYRKFQ